MSGQGEKNDEIPSDWPGMVAALRDIGVAKVHVTYSGGGDSGQIDEVDYRSADGLVVEVASPLAGKCEDLFYDLIGDHFGGYENNEGGEGTIELDVAVGTADCAHKNFTDEDGETWAETYEADDVSRLLREAGVTKVEASLDSFEEDGIGYLQASRGSTTVTESLPAELVDSVNDFLARTLKSFIEKHDIPLDSDEASGHGSATIYVSENATKFQWTETVQGHYEDGFFEELTEPLEGAGESE